jgi:hypothetical protein
MPRDPIVDEVRRVREGLAAKYGFDVKANPCGLEKATTPLQAQGCIVCSKKEVERQIQ